MAVPWDTEKAEANVLREKDKRRMTVKTRKTLFEKQVWIRKMLGMAVCLTAFCFCGFVSEAAEGKVKADTAKIRAEANTGSEVVGSTVKDKKIDILDAVKDSAGMVWYKVSVTGGGYGYIRSDLVETSDKIEVSGTTTAPESNNNNAQETEKPKPAETVPTAIAEQKATISQASVRIRAGASTAHDTVSSLPKGTEITLIGEASDNAGNKWYQMTCSYNNKTVKGYIRSDLITIGGTAENAGEGTGNAENTEDGENPGEPADGEMPEGEGAETEAPAEEEQQPPEPEHNDYEVVYTEEAYWLYDNINGTRQRLEDLMNVVSTANQNNEILQEQIQKEKMIVIILAVLVVILVIVVTLLFFKIRSLYYEDYEDYEEEEEEPEPMPVKKKVKRTEPEEAAPVKKKRPAPAADEGIREPKKKERVANKRPEGVERHEEAEKPAPRKAPRKSQNFLLDDDEFEFEFLNMDDKDL